MSRSGLSSRDIEIWAAKPTSQHGGAGIVAKLFTMINSSMVVLVTSLSPLEAGPRQICSNDYERFSLWGHGLCIADGDLDQVLARAKELRFQVLSILLRLGTVVLEVLDLGPAPLSGILREECTDLQTLLDTTETILKDSNADEATRPSTPTEFEQSKQELSELVEEISDYVDCLLDLTQSLDNPALDLEIERVDGSLARTQEEFTVSSDEALIYCRKIRDRFEVLPRYLIERLAEANASRAASLRERRSQPIKDTAEIRDDVTESLFTDTSPRLTQTTKSTATDPSIFSSLQSITRRPILKASDVIDDDNRSEATLASFSTAASAVGLGRPRVPPMPDVQEEGFKCPICFAFITGISDRKGWK